MKNLCFSGGGVKGIAYVGIYKYLIENNMLGDLENLSGSSAGAVMCLFVLLKYSVKELEILVEKMNYTLLEDLDIRGILYTYSLHTGNKLEYILQKILSSKGIDKNITFKQLYDKTGIGLHICTARLNDCSKVIFNHLNTPDIMVYKACKYSMNIPFLWASEQTHGVYYADGCLAENLPISMFPVEDTLGIMCHSDSKHCQIKDIKDYMLKSIESCLKRADAFEIDAYTKIGYNIIRIDMCTVSSLDFDIDTCTKKSMIEEGYRSALKQLKTK
jgi:predicted acylesterase/phospholipase RssA